MKGPRVLLSTGDVAAKYGLARSVAYRLMRELHDKYPRVVIRRGSRGDYYTTEEALATVMPDRPLTGHERRLRLAEEAVRDVRRLVEVAATDARKARREAETATRELRKAWEKIRTLEAQCARA